MAVYRDREVEEILGKTDSAAAAKRGASSASPDKPGDEPSEMDVAPTATVSDEEEQAALQAALAMSMAESADAAVPPTPVGPGLPLDFTGNYELFGVVRESVCVCVCVCVWMCVFACRQPNPHTYPPTFPPTHPPTQVTHKGRTADGGHYMGWVRQEGDSWLVFDDEDVSECKTAEVLQLSGGGDWHMAYLCFYRYKPNNNNKAAAATTTT